MSDFQTMKSRVGDELARDDLSSQIALAIKDAIREHEGKRLFFNEQRFRLLTIEDQEYYALSALTKTDESVLDAGVTLLEIDSITLEENGQRYTLNERTQQWMDRHQAPAATTTSTPTDYAIYGDEIRLYPIPDDGYECIISGLARLSTLSDEADTNAWMTDGEALIRHTAKKLLYRDVLRDATGLQLAMTAEAEALAALERKTAAKIGTGRIRAWGYV